MIYIDDLVSDATARKNGFGSKVLKWVISEAKKAKCDQVHLDSGPQRHDAHRLYLNHGFKSSPIKQQLGKWQDWIQIPTLKSSRDLSKKS